MRFLIVFLFSIVAFAQDRIVLQTSVLLDGKGAVLKNQQIVIEGGRIVSVGPDDPAKPVRVDSCVGVADSVISNWA